MTNTGTTMGQELQDLEEARRKDIINGEGYIEARKSLPDPYQQSLRKEIEPLYLGNLLNAI